MSGCGGAGELVMEQARQSWRCRHREILEDHDERPLETALPGKSGEVVAV
jgi:hypothetical protein